LLLWLLMWRMSLWMLMIHRTGVCVWSRAAMMVVLVAVAGIVLDVVVEGWRRMILVEIVGYSGAVVVVLRSAKEHE
jgi:hypothetical protein